MAAAGRDTDLDGLQQQLETLLAEVLRLRQGRGGRDPVVPDHHAPEPASGKPDGPVYPDRLSIRVRPEDRTRFSDYAYRHRIAHGDAFARMLDLVEAAEQAR